MKKLIFIVIMLFICNIINAQDWNTSGNSSTNPTTNFIGTTDTKDLTFRTDNTIKMQLESNGELGIGTTSPSAWLHVKSTGTKETFRTDVPQDYDNYWRMFRNGTEYGRFINFDNAFAFTKPAVSVIIILLNEISLSNLSL